MVKPKILCISALPPPYHGVSIANDILLNSALLHGKYDLRIVPLSKPKLQSGGGLSLATIAADAGVTLRALRAIITDKPRLTYFCLSQTPLGLWREAAWIWPPTLKGRKCLVHMHGGNFRHMFDQELSYGVRKFFKRTLNCLAGIIVLDSSLLSHFKGLVPEARIFVLKNGIPDYFDGIKVTEKRLARADSDTLRVTYLSNLVHGKGFNTFLNTAALLKKNEKAQDFHFNLAGAPSSPQIAAQVEDFVHSHRLGNFVSILGKVIGPEKWRLLLDSDVFVFPTQYKPEGQPLTVIEALAAGLPVISTARGCIPAMVRDGINGYIVAENNPGEIAERLIQLKSDPHLRMAMGQASREIYLAHHTEEKFVQGFVNIVDQVLESD